MSTYTIDTFSSPLSRHCPAHHKSLSIFRCPAQKHAILQPKKQASRKGIIHMEFANSPRKCIINVKRHHMHHPQTTGSTSP